MRKVLVGILLLAALTGCNEHKCVPNKVLDENAMESPVYKKELVRQLANTDLVKMQYYAGDYIADSTRQYMLVAMHGDQLCAFALMDITHCDRLDSYKEARGKQYMDAELSGVAFHIDSSAGKYDFVLDEVQAIAH